MSKMITLKNSREFGSVYSTKNSVANKYLVMYLRSNGLDYNSVVRHRVTRLIREAYRLNRANIDVGYDIVIVARPSSKDKKCQDIESALMHLCGLKKISHIG